MRLNYLFAVLLVIIGVGLSLFLVPRSKELALQNFRDHDFDRAREAYVARYQAGERAADTIMPLVGLSLDLGEVAEAIRYLESYVEREPDQLESRELLGQLYKADERMGDYLANLEELVRQRPTYDRVYELSSYYRFFGRFEKLEGALRKLIDVRPDDADVVLELAELQAARSKMDDAIATLTALDERDNGRKTSVPARALLTALLVEKGDVEQAFVRSDRWLDEKAPSFEILELVNLLVAAGRSDLAYRLIKPYEARAAKEEALALSFVDLETVLGRLEDARLRLTAWAARGRVPEGSIGRFISLAANAGLNQLALDVVRERDLRLVPDWALVGLADTAFRNKERVFLDRMVDELGENFLAERPVLAAEIALARDDKAAARRWALAALAERALPVSEHLTAVRQLVRADASERAVAAFDALPLSGALPDEVLADLGSLFIDLNRPEAGFRWFADRRRNKPSPFADIGWARLSARAGDAEQVVGWLDRTPQVEGWILLDIAAAANERNAPALALKAGERAYALSQSAEAAQILAGAYLANDRAAEALALVRPLLGLGGAPVEYIYTQALQALGMLEELAEYWTAKVATGVLNEKDADNALYAMLAGKAYAAVLPYLKERAETRGGDWIGAYAEAARGVGGDALAGYVDFLDQSIDRDDIDDREREQRLYVMMDISRAAAAETLARLTDRMPPRWWAMAADNLRELKRNDALAQMLERLILDEDVGRADRESMVYALIDAAGVERALPAIARLADEIGGPWDGSYREALTKLGRKDELRRYLQARAARPGLSPEDQRGLAFALLELDDKPAAETVLTALAAGQGPDGPDVRQLYYLWGPRPNDQALDWMERRAKQASGAAKAAWYAKMVEMGAKDRVLAALGDAEPPTDAVLLRPYIEAKAAKRDDAATAKAIKTAAKVETSPEILRRYARVAEQARRNDAAAAAWSALLALRPEDGDALRQLGMLAYDDLRYADAERLLRRYALRDPDDYEAYYFLGEALTLLKRPTEATPFYRVALSQLRAKAKPPTQAMQTEAGLLNRLGRVDEAVAVYERLRRLRPADRQIQADYANMLIEHRRWSEARNVLVVR